MKFDVIKSLISRNMNSVVLEASANKEVTIDVEGQSMGIWLLTDKIIEDNQIPEVVDPIMFKNRIDPTDGGLLSTKIFGETEKEKHLNCAYINLRRRFFHPFIYIILKKLSRNIDIIASGQGAWIVEDGQLIQIEDPTDNRYNEDNTGIGWLVEHFREIEFKDTGSSKRNDQLKLISSLSDDEIFVSKWIVIPIAYRDIQITSSGITNNEINDEYTKLLKLTKSYENEFLSITKYLTLNNIQQTLVTIFELGESLIEKKKGDFQKTILGKAPDFGGRGVISCPSLNGCDVPNDCIVDITHSGIPIAYCIVMGYPFMIKWCLEFFEDMFRNRSMIPHYVKNRKGEYEIRYEELEDPSTIFTQQYIDSKMEMFKKTYGPERFETVKVKRKDGKWGELYFPGRWYGTNPDDPRANTIGNRPLTWTDVFYMAAVDTLSDKFCYITRYPLLDYFGIFPSQVAVLSTIKTIPVIVNGKVYPHYPYIDLSLSGNEISTQFIDTFSISNLYLDAIGGD